MVLLKFLYIAFILFQIHILILFSKYIVTIHIVVQAKVLEPGD